MMTMMIPLSFQQHAPSFVARSSAHLGETRSFSLHFLPSSQFNVLFGKDGCWIDCGLCKLLCTYMNMSVWIYRRGGGERYAEHTTKHCELSFKHLVYMYIYRSIYLPDLYTSPFRHFSSTPIFPNIMCLHLHTFTPISPNALIGPNSKYDRNCSSLHEYTNPIIAAAFAEIFELASSPT